MTSGAKTGRVLLARGAVGQSKRCSVALLNMRRTSHVSRPWLIICLYGRCAAFSAAADHCCLSAFCRLFPKKWKLKILTKLKLLIHTIRDDSHEFRHIFWHSNHVLRANNHATGFRGYEVIASSELPLFATRPCTPFSYDCTRMSKLYGATSASLALAYRLWRWVIREFIQHSLLYSVTNNKLHCKRRHNAAFIRLVLRCARGYNTTPVRMTDRSSYRQDIWR